MCGNESKIRNIMLSRATHCAKSERPNARRPSPNIDRTPPHPLPTYSLPTHSCPNLLPDAPIQHPAPKNKGPQTLPSRGLRNDTHDAYEEAQIYKNTYNFTSIASLISIYAFSLTTCPPFTPACVFVLARLKTIAFCFASSQMVNTNM